jgi:hypothetical protein
MTTGPGVVIRPLEVADAPACDAVIRSLPYHIGDPDGYQRTRAFYRSVGFLPARELPDLWPGNKALLPAMPLAAS